MWAFFTWLWNGLKALFGLILPIAGEARRIGSPLVRWGIRILLLVLLCVGLYFLNRWLEVSTYVPRPHPLVGQFYLPILGLLLLGWVWLGWYLWRLLTEPVESDFPDIDAAWREATAALAEEGIDAAKTPIFLVLGRPLGGESALLEAAVAPSSRSLRVRGVPRAGAPLRVYANDDGIYVTCAGASVLGRFARLLERVGVPLPAAASPSLAGPGASAGGTIFKTMRVEGNIRQLQDLLRQGEKGEPSEEQQRKIRELLHGGAMSFAGAGRPGAGASLIRDEAELEEDAARLEHLCRLIARQRQPELPARGILVLVPWAASASDEAAAAAAEACRRDLAAARAALRVNCPTFAMVCDMETAPGFRELVGHFRAERRRTGRIGRKFPLLPDVAGKGVADVFASGLAWFCTAEFPTWIYEFFTLEQADAEQAEQATDGNVRLYQILAQLLERHERVSRILAPALTTEAGEPALFGGCYLSATGNKPDHDQAFVAAVFHRLVEEHKNTSWSPQAVR